MSRFFAAAAASNPKLVECHDYNVDRSFVQFAAPSDSTQTSTSELKSSLRQMELSKCLKPPVASSKRATSHLNNVHERIHGLELTNKFRDPDAPKVATRTHVIDKLQQSIREEIMADLDEDIQRSILAQQELR